MEVPCSLETLNEELETIGEEIGNAETAASERHADLIERLTRCETELKNLKESLPQSPQAENPSLNLILDQISQMRAEVAELKASLQAQTPSQNPPQPSDSSTPPQAPEPQSVVAVDLPEVEKQTPKPAERKVKRRFL